MYALPTSQSFLLTFTKVAPPARVTRELPFLVQSLLTSRIKRLPLTQDICPSYGTSGEVSLQSYGFWWRQTTVLSQTLTNSQYKNNSYQYWCIQLALFYKTPAVSSKDISCTRCLSFGNGYNEMLSIYEMHGISP